jgi:hypothetical protein
VFDGFQCIAEEAELMSELLACETKKSVEKDVFITEVLDDDSYNFSNQIRNIVLGTMINYKGPCSDSIAATFLVCSCLLQKSWFTKFEV